MHDDHCRHQHHHHCGDGDKDKKHENDWEEYLKEMTKEELEMKKEKLTKKLAMIEKLLEEK